MKLADTVLQTQVKLFNEPNDTTTTLPRIKREQHQDPNRLPVKNEISLNNTLILFRDSHILNEQQNFDLLRLSEFSLKEKWILIYRGSRDGFGARDFHSKCDDKFPTLTLLKAKQSSFIFGGYTSVTWNVTSFFDIRRQHKSDRNAFIFSLTNGDYNQYKMKTKNPSRSIKCSPRFGPIFGDDDIRVADNANKSESGSNLGFTFKHPIYARETNEAKSFLAGSNYFLLDEIEVYQRCTSNFNDLIFKEVKSVKNINFIFLR